MRVIRPSLLLGQSPKISNEVFNGQVGNLNWRIFLREQIQTVTLFTWKTMSPWYSFSSRKTQNVYLVGTTRNRFFMVGLQFVCQINF